MFGKYSLQNVMKVYHENKPLFTAYINGQSIEGLDEDPEESAKIAAYGGLGVILVIVILQVILFIWAAIAITTHWAKMPDWAKATSLILLFLGGSVFSLVKIYHCFHLFYNK